LKSIPKVLSQERLFDLTRRFKSVRAAVIGDIALDAYWIVDMTRSHLSRETPLFPRPIVSERYSPGAGGNVAQNLVALGIQQVTIFSVFGEDHWAGLLESELHRLGVSTEGILHSINRRTNVYIKPLLTGYNSQQEDARLDFENQLAVDAATERALLQRLESQLNQFDIVLVADQFEELGIITTSVRQGLVELAKKHPACWFLVDSRQRIGEFQHMVLKPNWLEAARAVYPQREPAQLLPSQMFTGEGAPSDELIHISQELAQRSKRPVFITLSERGVLTCPEQSVGVSPEQSVGVSPEQSVGVSPEQSVGVSPEQSDCQPGSWSYHGKIEPDRYCHPAGNFGTLRIRSITGE
jgi:bifunctional ADP-heptose synthase (sugar kinase/adenylyltransferase)